MAAKKKTKKKTPAKASGKKTTRKPAGKKRVAKKTIAKGTEKAKQDRGRPKKELSDMPNGWEKKMIDLASQGASDVELRVEALGGISNGLWYRLIEEEPEFAEVVKQCGDLCESWWAKQGRQNLTNTRFSPTLWYMNMKNRFGWADKHEHAGSEGGPIQHKVDHSAGVQFERILERVNQVIDEERGDD